MLFDFYEPKGTFHIRDYNIWKTMHLSWNCEVREMLGMGAAVIAPACLTLTSDVYLPAMFYIAPSIN